MGLSLASRPFYQLSGPGGSAPRSPLSCPQLRALSSPGLRGAFARLASSARPRAAARGRRGRRRGGGGLCPPPTPLSAGCWGRWQERRAPPAAGGEGWGRHKKGVPAWIRANRALQKGDGTVLPSRVPGTSKRPALLRPPSSALGPRSPGAAAWWP